MTRQIQVTLTFSVTLCILFKLSQLAPFMIRIRVVPNIAGLRSELNEIMHERVDFMG